MAKSQAPKDPLGQHVRVYYRIMDCHAWRALSPAARALWLDMARQAGATRNGLIGTHLQASRDDRSGLHGRGWASHHTVLRAARELECLGFAEREVQGGICQGGRTPTLWSLSHLDVFDNPHRGVKAHRATHVYTRWQSVEQAREALQAQARKKVKRQKLPLVGADSAPSGSKLGADSAMLPKRKGQKLPLAHDAKKGRTASIHAGCGPIDASAGKLDATMAEAAEPNRLPCVGGDYSRGSAGVGAGSPAASPWRQVAPAHRPAISPDGRPPVTWRNPHARDAISRLLAPLDWRH